MFEGQYDGSEGPDGATPEYTMNPSDAKMEKVEGMEFETAQEGGLMDDTTHLWKQEGDRMYLRTQEEYDADMAREKAERQKKRD